MGDAALTYVGHVLDLVADEWLWADRLAWSDIRSRHLASAAAADTQERCHAVVEALLRELDDGHSHLIRPGQAAAVAKRQPALPKGWTRGGVACVEVPFCMRNRHVSREGFAGLLQDALASLDAEGPTGWVVDLRRNGGGDMWPMLAGLGPMLGEGPFGSFVSGRTFAWTYRGGAAFNDGALMCRSERDPVVLRHAARRTAVLIGPGTASAGEAVSIAFKGRPETAFFGQATAGQSTATSSHNLSDGAILALTGALMADRDGMAYGRELHPDVAVPPPEVDSASDPTLDRAEAWIAAAEIGPRSSRTLPRDLS